MQDTVKCFHKCYNIMEDTEGERCVTRVWNTLGIMEYTVVPVLRDHSDERPPALKDHFSTDII